MINYNRTPASRSSDFVKYSYDYRPNWIPLCPFTILIVSITKFLIVIGSPRAYLSRNRRTITWVSNYRIPI